MKTKYKTILLKNSINNVIEELMSLKDSLQENGSVFFYVKNSYENNQIKEDIFDLMEYCTNIGLIYINTIIVPESTKEVYENIQYIIWFVKNKEKMYFNKDAIREKHIWKDVEWGKRAKNYNPKGKDPGNVWIPTLDNGKGKITEHILLTEGQVYTRIFDSTIEEQDNIFLFSDKESDAKFKYKNNSITFKYKKNNAGLLNEVKFKEDIFNNESNTNTKAQVVFGTSEKMDKIGDNTVKLVVTSPPYWDLKNYYKVNQIGQESYERYSDRMYTVWNECYKKLREDGSRWVNINVRVRNNKPIYIPKLFIEQCKKIGFIFKGILIWHKSSGIPTNAKNIVDRHEYVLIFLKSEKTIIKSFKLNKYSDYQNDNLNGGFIWNINRKAGSVGKKTIHPAIYPTELVNRIIKCSTNENDIVLDPFLGSGTSLIAALNNNRNFVGYEFNEGFKYLMIDRYGKELIEYNDEKIMFIE